MAGNRVNVPNSFEMHEGTDFNGVGWYRRQLPQVDLKPGQRVCSCAFTGQRRKQPSGAVSLSREHNPPKVIRLGSILVGGPRSIVT